LKLNLDEMETSTNEVLEKNPPKQGLKPSIPKNFPLRHPKVLEKNPPKQGLKLLMDYQREGYAKQF